LQSDPVWIACRESLAPGRTDLPGFGGEKLARGSIPGDTAVTGLVFGSMTIRAFYKVVAVGTVSLLGVMFAVDVMCVAFRWDSVRLIERLPTLVLLPFALLGGYTRADLRHCDTLS